MVPVGASTMNPVPFRIGCWLPGKRTPMATTPLCKRRNASAVVPSLVAMDARSRPGLGCVPWRRVVQTTRRAPASGARRLNVS
eukprot:5669936-Prymnesium_polylepis.1